MKLVDISGRKYLISDS